MNPFFFEGFPLIFRVNETVPVVSQQTIDGFHLRGDDFKENLNEEMLFLCLRCNYCTGYHQNMKYSANNVIKCWSLFYKLLSLKCDLIQIKTDSEN